MICSKRMQQRLPVELPASEDGTECSSLIFITYKFESYKRCVLYQYNQQIKKQMSNNKGYRKYIRDRMSQIIQLLPASSKPQLKIKKTAIDLKKMDTHEDDTTIMHNGSKETLAQKNLGLKEEKANFNEVKGKQSSKYYFRVDKSVSKKPFLKIKSEQTLIRDNKNSPYYKKGFSVRRHTNISLSKSKQSLFINGGKMNDKFQTREGRKLKNQKLLKQNLGLRKTSSKLKLKVKDPFEKKLKLDNEFQNQSCVSHHQESFISETHEEEFRSILKELS